MPSLSGALAAKASAVAKVPSFQWLDTASKVPTVMADTLADIRAANKAGANPPYAGLFVVYDLPDRDCAAAASNGEYSIANGGVANYKAYIDAIRAQLVAYSDLRILLIVEPDSLANLVTNMNVAKCSGAHDAYLECVNYAVKQLNLPNVAMYLDAGHAGWLGWSANLQPAATLFANVYTNAGKPAALRGLATNVANYNGWNLTSPPSYTQGNSNYDEIHYVQAIAPLLSSAGWNAHFVTDTGRSGKQPTGQQAYVFHFTTCSTTANRWSAGVTGAIKRVLGSVCVQLPTLGLSLRMRSSGSSPVANATAPATLVQLDTTSTAACQTLCSLRLKLVHGSRHTLSSCSRTPTLLSKPPPTLSTWSVSERASTPVQTHSKGLKAA